MTIPKAAAIKAFEEETKKTIESYKNDSEWQKVSLEWMKHALKKRYVYNFSSLGRPIIQMPSDIVAVQEVVWNTRPDLIIETGIAHGGSLIYSASLLSLLDYCDAIEANETLDPKKPKRRVLGIDIDIRDHNRAAIEAHPMSNRIDMIQGSSIAPEIFVQVQAYAKKYKRILICLDSNHTHDHVLRELELYAPLTTEGSYCLTFDTIVEDMPDDMYPDRPWGPGNNPKTAVHEYLKKLSQENIMAADGKRLKLEIDHALEDKLLLTVSPHGFLKRV